MQLSPWNLARQHTGPRSKIAVLIACFNRKQKTLACIDAVLAQSALVDVVLDFYVTDDASSDGTGDALLLSYPGIWVSRGNGALFWNGGMRLAWEQAFKGDYDFYLWLNDDTFLYPGALQGMLDADAEGIVKGGRAGIVVGATEDGTGRTSYGGELQKSACLPLTLTRLEPNGKLQACDTFNGNCVLVSRAAAGILGNLDRGFVHAMGDTDYGLRAKRQGVPVWLMPFFAGRCVNDHQVEGCYRDSALPLAKRLQNKLSAKSLPWRPWKILCRRHAGIAWPVYWLWPYVKTVFVPDWPRKNSALSKGSPNSARPPQDRKDHPMSSVMPAQIAAEPTKHGLNTEEQRHDKNRNDYQ